MLRLCAALLLAAILLAPALEADVIPISRDLQLPDLSHIEYSVAGRYTDQDATDLRTAVDSDSDGTVTAAEEAWFVSLIETYGSGVSSSEPRIDNVSASTGTLDVSSITGLVGPVASTAPIDLTLARALTYPAAATLPEHKLFLPNPSAEASAAVQVLHAPPGWRIHSHSGFPSTASVSASGDRLTYTEDGTGHDPLVLVFRPGSAGTTSSTTAATTTTSTSTTTPGTSTTTSTTTKATTGTSTTTTKTATSSGTGASTTTMVTSSTGASTAATSGTGTATSSSAGATSGSSGGSSASTSSAPCLSIFGCGKPSSSTTSSAAASSSSDSTSLSRSSSLLDVTGSLAARGAQSGAVGLPQGEPRARADSEGKDAAGILVLPAVGALLALAALRRRLP